MTHETNDNPLAEFGRFLMVNLRDRGIDDLDSALGAKWKAPSFQKLQEDLKSLDPSQRELVRRAFINSMDAALHDFLFALQVQADHHGRVVMMVDGGPVAQMSDGLPGELFTEEGWFARYSAHGEPPEEA